MVGGGGGGGVGLCGPNLMFRQVVPTQGDSPAAVVANSNVREFMQSAAASRPTSLYYSCVYVYIYIYIEREREIEGEREII